MSVSSAPAPTTSESATPTASAAPTATVPDDDASDARPKGLRKLPALSKSGGSIAYYGVASSGGDGSRYGFFVLDVKTDRALTKIPIDFPDETDPTLRPKRIASAQAALDGDTWTALVPLTMGSDATVAPRMQGLGQTMPQVGTSEHLEVHFEEPTLTILVDGKRVLRRGFASWSDKPSATCAGCPPCPGALADLSAAWADEAKRIVFVAIDYSGGTDLCWEPPASYHAVKY